MKKVIVISSIVLCFVLGLLVNNHMQFLSDYEAARPDTLPEDCSITINPVTNNIVIKSDSGDPKIFLALKMFRNELQYNISTKINEAAKDKHDYYVYLVPFSVEIFVLPGTSENFPYLPPVWDKPVRID